MAPMWVGGGAKWVVAPIGGRQWRQLAIVYNAQLSIVLCALSFILRGINYIDLPRPTNDPNTAPPRVGHVAISRPGGRQT